MIWNYLYAGPALLSAVLLLSNGVAVQAQPKRFTGDVNKKSYSKILDLFTPVVAKPALSTTAIEVDGKTACLGVIVDAGGYILTKDSELTKSSELKSDKNGSELKSDKIVVKFKDRKELTARKIATNEDFDLAMLKVEATDLTPATWSFSTVDPVGNWVVTPGITDKPLAIGVISVAARNMPPGPKFALPSNYADRGYLGIRLAPDERGGVKITYVEPKGAADKAGLKAEDTIIAVEGRETPDPQTLSLTVGRCKPGETILIRYRRGDKEEEVKAKLEKRPQNFPPDRSDMQNSMGTSRSERRTGFPVALQHDTDLKASQCGGPLVDIEGRVIGINIARGGRTDTYAIPAETILPLIPDMMKGKSLVSAKVPTSLSERKKAAEANVKEKETAKAVAEKELAKAKAALEKVLEEEKKEADRKKELEKKEKEKKEQQKRDQLKKDSEKKPDEKKSDEKKSDEKK